MSEFYDKEKIIIQNKKAVRKGSLISDLSAVSKIVSFIIFIGFTVSFNRYDLYGVLPMGIYPLCMIILSEIPLSKFLKPILVVLPFGLLTGIGNIIFDSTYFGIISAVTLLLKMIYSVICLYILSHTSSMEHIYSAMRKLHIPEIIVTVIMFTYRYLFIMITQAKTMYESYIVRAPREKSVKIKIFGIMTGQLLIRSFDRAKEVYESMLLRGYGSKINISYNEKIKFSDVLFFVITVIFAVFIKYTDIISKIGGLFI